MKILYKSLLGMNMFIGVSMGGGGSDLFCTLPGPSECCGWERLGKEDRCASVSTTSKPSTTASTDVSSPTFSELDRASSCSTGGSEGSDISNNGIKGIYRSIGEFQVTKNRFDQEIQEATSGALKERAEWICRNASALVIIDECKMRQGLPLNKSAPLDWFQLNTKSKFKH